MHERRREYDTWILAKSRGARLGRLAFGNILIWLQPISTGGSVQFAIHSSG